MSEPKKAYTLDIEPRIKSPYNRLYRNMIDVSCMYFIPLGFMVKNRHKFIDASRLQLGHMTKELLFRFFLGFIAAGFINYNLFGKRYLDPDLNLWYTMMGKQPPPKEEDQTTLSNDEFSLKMTSTTLKKNNEFYTSGKIRD